MKKSIYGIIIGLFLITGCASTKFEKNMIQGMIYNNENEVVTDAAIYLNDKEVTVSDIYGHFTLNQAFDNAEYKLTARKKGYEDSGVSFRFLNESQVVYLKMYSAGELLDEAEKKVSEREYGEALQYLERSEAAGGSKLSIKFLKSVIYFHQQEYEKALEVAESLTSEGYSEPYVYLLLADIYEYGLGDMEQAKKNLEMYLKFSFDPAVKARLEK